MDIEQKVAAHYGRPALARAILDALAAAGRDPATLRPEDTSGADEFHLGWHAATVAFADALALPAGARVLDVGAGVGGPARHFGLRGVHVTGIDLSPDYVEAANTITRLCGLADRVAFEVGSALALPFADASFDGAYTIHVGMNIEDKARLFAETRRVLKPGARFGIYDVMRAGDGDIPYPMPWAATAATSFVETSATYRRLLAAAGFAIESERDRSDFVRDVARRRRAEADRDGPPPLSLHVVMGPATPERLGNVMTALEARLITPVEIIARAA